MILRAAAYCTIITFSTIVGFILFDNLGTPEMVMALPAKFYTNSNGEWSGSVWSDVSNSGPSCGCNPTCNLAIPARIKHRLTVTSCANFTISGGVQVDIDSGGQMFVTATKFTISGGSTVKVAAGDSLIVDGKLELSGTSKIICEGILVVSGDVKLSGGSSICGGGNGYVIDGGTISGSGWCFTGTLPVELISFEAKKKDNAVDLNWSTASEINNDYFTIERSFDGKLFSTLQIIRGAGNSTQVLNYFYKDLYPLLGDNYYRLRQTDYDGNTETFEIKHVRFSDSNKSIFLYPNPSRLNEQISLKLPAGNFTGRLSVYSLSGEIVLEEAINSSSMDVLIESEKLNQAGVYILILSNENNEKISVIKFSKV